MKRATALLLPVLVLSACASFPSSAMTPTGTNIPIPTPAHIETIPPPNTPSPTEFQPTFTETPVPPATETPQIPFENGPSREFSTLYPAEWHNKWTGHVEGLDMPIIVGLAYDVVHDTTFPVTPFIGVTITQGGADAVADAFLRASHYRYTKLMGNDVTYEQYLELLK